MAYTISVDTGGTFTDVIVADSSGRMTVGKALTRDRIFLGMKEAIEAAAEQLQISFSQLLGETNLLIYGTTRATNAIVTKSIAKTAFVTTAGFAETLLLKEGGKFNPHDFAHDYPDPYIPKRFTFEVEERMSSEGTVSKPFNSSQARRVAESIRDGGFEAVAVSLLWSIANPDHELRFAKLLDEVLPGVPYTLSHQLVPIVREYRRASATAIDASLKPLMQRHLKGLQQDLHEAGFNGELLISTAAGGCSNVGALIEKPIYTVGSGPAMAPIAGLTFSMLEKLGNNVIVCDAGGTTFDVGLVRDGNLTYTRDSWLGPRYTGDLLGISAVDVRSIGAGGGSIAWIDDGGLMRVGPQSAGADPGPACYGRGGTLPTVSDAAVVLGYFDPEFFLGGRMRLDVGAARRAIETVASRLGSTIEDTAYRIISLAGEFMMRAISDITINEGVNPRESTIVAGGGAAGLNVMLIAQELGCENVVLPKVASALSASGMQSSNIVAEETASVVSLSNRFDSGKVNAALAELKDRLEVFRRGLGDRGKDYRIDYFAEARYLGQVWELDTPLKSGRFADQADIDALVNAFHEVHERVFAVRDEGSPVEVVNWKARLTTKIASQVLPGAAPTQRADAKPSAVRQCYFGNLGSVSTSIYKPADLSVGATIKGPAIVEEPTTTLVVYPGMSATVSSAGNYRLRLDKTVTVTSTTGGEFDPYLTAIIANRIDGIVREMTNTLLRAARSAVINSARDFSCAICTADNQLLASAEGLPIHIFGSHMLTSAMTARHAGDMREGDCYLHNDPYSGNSHAADHAFLVPVFFEGEHLFTTVAKAHQADIGNALPTTYMAQARDQYEEGALIFPAVRIQRDYKMNEDIVAMCRSRIRVPNQWFGDFLAGVGAARTAERRLKELCQKYGRETIKNFIANWMDYSEQRMIQAVKKLPRASASNDGAHDPLAGLLPNGVPLNVKLRIDPDNALIELDLRDNVDNVPCGFNESEACVTAAVFSGVFNSIDPTVPRNAGSFRRLRLHLRDGSVAGRPAFPHSCSLATTNVADRLINITQSAFASIGDTFGLAEGGIGMGAGTAVISGKDHRLGNEPYVNQLIATAAGGPGSPSADGWPNYCLPVVAGLMYRDSVEVDEIKHPLEFQYLRAVPGSAGAGKYRGSFAVEISYGPKEHPMDAIWPCDGTHYPPKGVRGGHNGVKAQHWKVSANGAEEELPNVVIMTIKKGELIRGNTTSGGGYGNPLERDPRRVLKDVLDGFEPIDRARDVYGVAFTGSLATNDLAIDHEQTGKLRKLGGGRSTQ